MTTNTKLYFYFLLLSISMGCNESSQNIKTQKTVDTISLNDSTNKDISINKDIIKNLQSLKLENELSSYEAVRQSIQQNRTKLNTPSIDIDSVSIAFEKALLRRIIPFWEGTKWTFEGHTATPNVGTIACGYFVSTTLKHVGLNLNRYKLAQQSPINEAKSLAIDITVKEISENSITENIAAIDRYLREGIHFIGFDQSHVGFILKKGDNLYLIHSNYIYAAGVEIDPIETSDAFSSYDRFCIVELSTNPHLLKRWLNQLKIPIVTE